jgi:hypothetical protein
MLHSFRLKQHPLKILAVPSGCQWSRFKCRNARIFRSVWIASKSHDLSAVMSLSLCARSPVRHATCKAHISDELTHSLTFITQNSVHCAVKQNSTIGVTVTDWTNDPADCGTARYVRHAHNIPHS